MFIFQLENVPYIIYIYCYVIKKQQLKYHHWHWPKKSSTGRPLLLTMQTSTTQARHQPRKALSSPSDLTDHMNLKILEKEITRHPLPPSFVCFFKQVPAVVTIRSSLACLPVFTVSLL